ncbi:MAG TPA: LuxR C-terminal-related transcriptional regulator [Candidatus Acidoferrum sp.]
MVSLLGHCTIGAALFDANLQCRAFNGALSNMIGVSVKRHIGKNVHELFPGVSTQLELAFRRVWTTRNSLANLEVTVPLPANSEPRRWLVNFYPISDELGEVRLVAATFSEITKERWVESKIVRLRDKFHSGGGRQRDPLEEEFSEMSTRTFEVVSRSVAILRSSVLLRFYASQMRLAAGLGRHSLFLKANQEQYSTPSFAPPNATVEPDPSAGREPHGANDPNAGAPSPREREVLHFLADGKSNKEIGAILDLSTRTVESYRARIMLKLDLHSTAALVRYAVRHKIIEA